MLDAELAALLWIMAESGTPLVVASGSADTADELRNAVAELASAGAGLSDTRLAGRSIAGATSLEHVLESYGTDGGTGAAHAGGVSDAARELGLVVVIGRAGADVRERVTSAHYLRPIERDGAGHLQRRPPALLAAWNARREELDHFDWGISDELASRARKSVGEFVKLQRERARLFDEHGGTRSDAPN